MPVPSWPLRTPGRAPSVRRVTWAIAKSRGTAGAGSAWLKRPEPVGYRLGDPALQADFRKALRVYERDVPLLINGETGSGKEAFAKAVHHASQRAEKAFVALNCAAIPSLIEASCSVTAAAASPAHARRACAASCSRPMAGRCSSMKSATCPWPCRPVCCGCWKIGEVVPIGGEPESVNVRIISATHRNLLEQVQDGSFREDLYYRLNGLEVALPALRERSDKSPVARLLAGRRGARGNGIDRRAGARGVAGIRLAGQRARRCAMCCVRWRRCVTADGSALEDLPAMIRQARPVVMPKIEAALRASTGRCRAAWRC